VQRASGPHIRAAFIHDILYAAELFPRDECDDIFLELMKEHGVGWFTRNSMYLAVRMVGGLVWRKHTAASLQHSRIFISVVY